MNGGTRNGTFSRLTAAHVSLHPGVLVFSRDIDLEPGNSFSAGFEAPAKREIAFCERFGKPRLHIERYLRELHQFQNLSPIPYQHLLTNYLKLAPCLDVPSDHRISRPTLRHPDFSPNNILVNKSNDVVGVIDWQHAVILPLFLCAGIPDHFQNWGDPLSETLSKPEVKFQKILINSAKKNRKLFKRRCGDGLFIFIMLRGP